MSGIIAMPQQLIIGMPAHVIMQDMPLDIIDVSMVHMSFIMSMVVPSPAIIMHIIPCSVISQVMRQLMGIIIAMGMVGMDIGIEPIGMEGIALMKFSSNEYLTIKRVATGLYNCNGGHHSYPFYRAQHHDSTRIF